MSASRSLRLGPEQGVKIVRSSGRLLLIRAQPLGRALSCPRSARYQSRHLRGRNARIAGEQIGQLHNQSPSPLKKQAASSRSSSASVSPFVIMPLCPTPRRPAPLPEPPRVVVGRMPPPLRVYDTYCPTRLPAGRLRRVAWYARPHPMRAALGLGQQRPGVSTQPKEHEIERRRHRIRPDRQHHVGVGRPARHTPAAPRAGGDRAGGA